MNRVRLALIALYLVACAAEAAPKWEIVGDYSTPNGARAVVSMDSDSLVPIGPLIRGWSMTNYSKFQFGEWQKPEGESTAYMSIQTYMVFDCKARAIGYGAMHYFDDFFGGGKIVNSYPAPIPKEASDPVRPGSVAAGILDWVCKRKL